MAVVHYPRMQQYNDRRLLAVRERSRGTTYNALRKKYGLSPAFVSRWQRRYLDTGDVQDLPRSGGPKKLTPVDERRVLKSLTKGRSLRRTAAYMESTYGTLITSTTVRSIAEAHDLRYERGSSKKNPSSVIKSQRLTFATTPRPRGFWNRVMWSAEASITGLSMEVGSRIRVWAAISAKGKTPLIQIPESMNSVKYVQLLEKSMIPAMNRAFGGKPQSYVFMQDGDGCHTAKITREFLEKADVKLLTPWPSHSPDLNPIKTVWAMVQSEVLTSRARTKRGLWKAMKDAWDKIDDKTIRDLCKDVPNLLEEVIDADGGHQKGAWVDSTM